MSALPIITELSGRGIRVCLDGSDLVFSPKRALTPDLVERIKAGKPALLRDLQKVREQAGTEWDEISSDPKLLKAFYELLMIVEMRPQGIVPDHYIGTTTCKRCGPVPIFPGVPETVDSCPWCFNRVKGLPIPQEGA